MDTVKNDPPQVMMQLTAAPATRRAWAADVWAHRQVTLMLARKDFQTRYKRASFGILWAVLLPLVQAAVFVVVFSRVGHFNHTTFDYSAFVLAGTLSWAYFAMVGQSASTSIVDGASMTDKVWFPRSVLVLVPVLSNLFSLLTSMVLLLIALPIVGAHFTWRLLLLLPAIGLLVAFSVGFGLVTSALYVYFRDVRFIVQAGLLVVFYLTPIVYPATSLHSIGPYMALNPMTGIIGIFQLAAAGPFGPMAHALAVSLVATVLLLGIGMEANRRRDRLFVDQL
ncbi:MAG TPA: ABC transporter permease [Acidimicrobiales bacterium]|jgi:lipopolysaccharide transport system permease protein